YQSQYGGSGVIEVSLCARGQHESDTVGLESDTPLKAPPSSDRDYRGVMVINAAGTHQISVQHLGPSHLTLVPSVRSDPSLTVAMGTVDHARTVYAVHREREKVVVRGVVSDVFGNTASARQCNMGQTPISIALSAPWVSGGVRSKKTPQGLVFGRLGETECFRVNGYDTFREAVTGRVTFSDTSLHMDSLPILQLPQGVSARDSVDMSLPLPTFHLPFNVHIKVHDTLLPVLYVPPTPVSLSLSFSAVEKECPGVTLTRTLDLLKDKGVPCVVNRGGEVERGKEREHERKGKLCLSSHSLAILLLNQAPDSISQPVSNVLMALPLAWKGETGVSSLCVRPDKGDVELEVRMGHDLVLERVHVKSRARHLSPELLSACIVHMVHVQAEQGAASVPHGVKTISGLDGVTRHPRRTVPLRLDRNMPLMPQVAEQLDNDTLSLFTHSDKKSAVHVRVYFDGEEGIDLGGLLRDFLSTCVDEVVDTPPLGFCQLSPSLGQWGVTLDGPSCTVGTVREYPTKDQLLTLKSIGHVIGIALAYGYSVPLRLTHTLHQAVLSCSFNDKDAQKDKVRWGVWGGLKRALANREPPRALLCNEHPAVFGLRLDLTAGDCVGLCAYDDITYLKGRLSMLGLDDAILEQTCISFAETESGSDGHVDFPLSDKPSKGVDGQTVYSWIAASCYHHLLGRCYLETETLVAGILEIVPGLIDSSLSLQSPSAEAQAASLSLSRRDLAMRLCGVPLGAALSDGVPWLEPDVLQRHTGLVPGSERVARHRRCLEMFWQVYASLTPAERVQLYMFATGTAAPPSNTDDRWLFLYVMRDRNGLLPRGHTCSRQLDVPCVKEIADLSRRIHIAIAETSGFGFS
ncbi:hypothetical protein KIPB_003728, partial [Kipferlia bialata]